MHFSTEIDSNVKNPNQSCNKPKQESGETHRAVGRDYCHTGELVFLLSAIVLKVDTIDSVLPVSMLIFSSNSV